MIAQKSSTKQPGEPGRKGESTRKFLDLAGIAIAWLWSKLMVLVGIAAVVLVVWGLFFWTDSEAESTMRAELEARAFTEITTIDAPLYVQSHVLGDYGTYSAKAGNCRLTITTPEGRPSVRVDGVDVSEVSAQIEDADLTKLRAAPLLGYCFP